MAVAYDHLAGSYDQIYADHRCRAEDYALRKELTPLVSDRRVLDLGCGTGFLLDLVPAVNPVKYTGVDVSEMMLARARIKHPAATFTIGDQYRLKVKEDSYDAVTSFWSLNYSDLTGLGRAVRAAWRGLRPGGVFYAVIATAKRLDRVAYGDEIPAHPTWPAADVRRRLLWWPGLTVRGLAMAVDHLPRRLPQAVHNLVTRIETHTLGHVMPDRFFFFVITGVKR